MCLVFCLKNDLLVVYEAHALSRPLNFLVDVVVSKLMKISTDTFVLRTYRLPPPSVGKVDSTLQCVSSLNDVRYDKLTCFLEFSGFSCMFSVIIH